MITTEQYLEARAVVEQYHKELGDMLKSTSIDSVYIDQRMQALKDYKIDDTIPCKYQMSGRTTNSVKRGLYPHGCKSTDDVIICDTYFDLADFVVHNGFHRLYLTPSLGKKAYTEIIEFFTVYFSKDWVDEHNW